FEGCSGVILRSEYVCSQSAGLLKGASRFLQLWAEFCGTAGGNCPGGVSRFDGVCCRCWGPLGAGVYPKRMLPMARAPLTAMRPARQRLKRPNLPGQVGVPRLSGRDFNINDLSAV